MTKITIEEAEARLLELHSSEDDLTPNALSLLESYRELNIKFFGKFRHGLVTTQPESMAALNAALDGVERLYYPNKDIRYFRGLIQTANNVSRPVIFANASNPGSTSTAILVTHLQNDFSNLKEVVLVGTASALQVWHEGAYDVSLGDVIVSTQGMAEFELVANPTTFKQRSSAQASARLIGATMDLAADDMQDGAKPKWHSDLRRTLSGVHGSERPEGPVVRDREPKKPSLRNPRVHKGLLGSGPKILKDKCHKEAWEQTEVIALEHDKFGILDVSWLSEIEFITVRGIATYCYTEGERAWLTYASCVAVSYAVALLREL